MQFVRITPGDPEPELLVALSLCVDQSAEFGRATPLPSDAIVPLAIHDASSCPDSLELSDEAFNEKFANKFAIWLSYTASDTSCDRDFFSPSKWYKRMVDAGALGVVSIVPTLGRHAGFYSDWMGRREVFANTVLSNLNETDYIPFLSCSNPDAGGQGAFSQANLTSLVDNWYRAPADRVAPFDVGSELFVTNIVTSANPWDVLHASSLYYYSFAVFFPALYFAVACLATYFSFERVVRGRRMGQSLRTALTFTPPLTTLQIEGMTSLFLAMFYVMDGWGGNSNSPLKALRPLLVGQLLLLSTATSILVALTFYDIRKTVRNLSTTKSFLARHRRTLVVTSGALIILELVTALVRYSMPVLYQVANAVALLLALMVGFWFLYEARKFAWLLSGISDGSNSSDEAVRALLEHTKRWTYASSALLFLIFLSGVILTFHPYVLWRVENWGVIWFFVILLRALYSACKIVLCRLPPAQRNDDEGNVRVPRRTGGVSGGGGASGVSDGEALSTHSQFWVSVKGFVNGGRRTVSGKLVVSNGEVRKGSET